MSLRNTAAVTTTRGNVPSAAILLVQGTWNATPRSRKRKGDGRVKRVLEAGTRKGLTVYRSTNY